MKALHAALIGFATIVLMTSCGGGGNSAGGGTQAPPPPPQFTITTTSIPLALVGTPYSVQLTSANGTAPLTWTVTPWMPPGLSLSSSGLITGNPTSVMCGTGSSIAVKVTDSSTPPKTATANLKYDAAGLYVDLRQGQVNAFYDQGIQFQCATDPISWVLLSGSIPPGLTMHPFPGVSAQLNFEGTPTQAGTFTVEVQAQDASNRSVRQTASINILPPVLKIADGLMQLGVVNQPFHHTGTTTGGTPPYSFAISAGALAAGLQLNATTGEISGTPSKAGYYQFNVKVTDTTKPTPFTVEKPYTMLVTAAALQPRNDSIADATPIFPGTYIASLSPYADSAGNAAPDQDYYVLTGNGGDVYNLAVLNEYFPWLATYSGVVPTPTDSAIEILDSTGTRLTTCNDPFADTAPGGAPITKGAGNFTDACMNHDGDKTTPGISYLSLQLPAGLNQSFYIHVFDFQGRARPDLIYMLSVSKQ